MTTMNSLIERIMEMPLRVFRKLRFEYRVVTRRGAHDKSSHRLPLEQSIFPYFVKDSEYRSVLFVGCSVTTLWYEKIFKLKDYWTIDIDPQKARLGSKNHVKDALKNLVKHFKEDYFDVIYMNGIIGWGIDDKEEAEKSVNACYVCLRPSGKLIIGWNDIPERCPFIIDDLQSLKQFKRWDFPPFQTWRFLIRQPSSYYYDFYVKPLKDSSI